MVLDCVVVLCDLCSNYKYERIVKVNKVTYKLYNCVFRSCLKLGEGASPLRPPKWDISGKISAIKSVCTYCTKRLHEYLKFLKKKKILENSLKT